MALKKNDFVSIDFRGRVKDGDIFDSTLKEDLEKLHTGHSHKIEAKPFVFPLGQEMFMKAIDDFLIGKPEEKKDYEIDLEPKDAFGPRVSELVQTMPMRIFKEHNVNPVPGMSFDFDGKAGKILTSSGGRVIVDFNHPLAGKPVSYTINFLKKISDMNEKVNAMNDFFFRKEFPFEIKDKKLILKVDKGYKGIAELFKDKYKDILGLDLEAVEPEEKPKESDKKSQ